jgi:ubiquitin C-terminal hydrolase
MNIVGLENCGNSCYLNSAIQTLYSIKEYREGILNYKIIKNNKEHKVINIIKKVFKLIDISNNRLNNKSNKYISSNKICSLFEELHNTCFYSIGIKWGQQADSQEILSFIIDKTCELLNLKKIFSFNLITSSYCKINNIKINKENRSEESLLLSLPLYKKCNSILKLINEYEKTEKLETSLSRCSKLKTSYRKLNINIPEKNKYLFIQLKRFNYKKGEIEFIDRKIQVNHKIKLSNKKFILKNCILIKDNHYICAIYKNCKLIRVYNDIICSNNLGNFELNKNGYIFIYEKELNKK